MFALAGLAAAALVLFITAIGVTIWLCRNREQRRADGKTNVGWVVFLIIAYLLSASYLVFFVLLMISAFTGNPSRWVDALPADGRAQCVCSAFG